MGADHLRAAVNIPVEKPLFIPLKGEYFDAFAAGTKHAEYRPHNGRWNAVTCRVGRRVLLSRGYGRQHRLWATITAFAIELSPQSLPGWLACYGHRHSEACVITLQIDASQPISNILPEAEIAPPSEKPASPLQAVAVQPLLG